MATRLTNAMRHTIHDKADALAFTDRRKALELETQKLALTIYAHEVGDDDVVTRTLAAKGWVEMDNHIPIKCEAWLRGTDKIKVPSEHPQKDIWRYGGGIVIEKGHKHYEDLRKLRAKSDKLEEDADEFRRNLYSIMAGVSTVEKLRERWPDCDTVIPTEAAPVPQYAVVPVNLINDINKQLGIQHG